MKRFLCFGSMFVMAAVSSSWGNGPDKPHAPCEPGFRWVEEVRYKEVERKVCKIVPDVKKHTKVVYSIKDAPFCIHHNGKGNLCAPGGHCDKKNAPGCPSCEGPYCRKQLVKKLVVHEEPTTKCVVETIVERVPYVVRKKAPCGMCGGCPSGCSGCVAGSIVPHGLRSSPNLGAASAIAPVATAVTPVVTQSASAPLVPVATPVVLPSRLSSDVPPFSATPSRHPAEPAP